MSQQSTVEDVLFGFYAWLDHHPTETILLSFQYEGSTQPNASNDAFVQQRLFDILTTPAARRYFVQDHDVLPTLGAARGKAVLLRRFVLDQLAPPDAEASLPGLALPSAKWPDNGKDFSLVYNAATNATAYVEDYYEPTAEDGVPLSANASANIAAKLAATARHLAKAADAATAPDGFFITFASAERNDAVVPVYPETMAVGNASAPEPFTGVNQALLPVLGTLRGKRVGVVVLDFVGEPPGLVDAILNL